MANKRETARRIAEQESVKQKQEAKKDNIFFIILAVSGVILLLFYFLNFIQIYNSDYKENNGIEIGATGWSFLVAFLTNSFSTSKAIMPVLKDLDLFYYWVNNQNGDTYLQTVGLTTLLSVITTVALIVVGTVNYFKRNKVLHIANVFVSFGTTVLLFISFFFSLATDRDMILGYCGGNPKCSVESLAIIPAIISLIITGYAVYIYMKKFKNK